MPEQKILKEKLIDKLWKEEQEKLNKIFLKGNIIKNKENSLNSIEETEKNKNWWNYPKTIENQSPIPNPQIKINIILNKVKIKK